MKYVRDLVLHHGFPAKKFNEKRTSAKCRCTFRKSKIWFKTMSYCAIKTLKKRKIYY